MSKNHIHLPHYGNIKKNPRMKQIFSLWEGEKKMELCRYAGMTLSHRASTPPQMISISAPNTK